MDSFGLLLHVTGGIAGGVWAWRRREAAREDRASMALAAAVGGLIGGQIAERSMALEMSSISPATFDLGAAIVSAGGAVAGGAALALLIGCLERCLARKRGGPSAL